MSEPPKSAKKSPRKPPEPASCWFCAVIQSDFASQMDVLRWIEKDASYICFYILHDKDTFTEEEIEARAEKDQNGNSLHFITRLNGDGSKSQFRAGDIKPPHYHLMLSASSKMRASTLYKRFCNQVYFEIPQKDFGDRIEACHYLTHEAFRARNKHKYPRSDVRFSSSRAEESKQSYNEMMQGESVTVLDTVRTVKQCKDAMRKAGADDLSAIRGAVSALIDSSDIAGIKAVMSRAYFFDKLL